MDRKVRIVNISSEKCDVYIGRPSIWGNPYKIGVDGSRLQVIELYRQHIYNSPHLLSQLETLRGKTLGCYCKPKACHGDVLVSLVNALDNQDLFNL